MKTKFILTAMCLPLAFAACTNEDVLVGNQNALEGKKVVDFKVSATYSADGAESRMVNNNGTFLWEGTDVLGAAWNLDGSIYSNNKFVNTLTEASATADFTTQATTVVGGYVFYYPYNTDVTKDLDSGIVYSLPEPQEYDPTGEKMMENNFMISPNIKVDGNEPGELTLPLTMRSIYAYGQVNIKLPEVFVIENKNVNSVKIQKIIISYESNVYKNGKINLNNVTPANITTTAINTYISKNGGTAAEARNAILTASDKVLTAQSSAYSGGEILNLTAPGEGGSNKIGQVSIACVSEENPNGITLSKNGTFSTRVLLPTTINDGAKVTVKVYTDKGMFVVLQNSLSRIKAGHTANLADLNRTGITDAFELDKDQIEKVESIEAISEADFIASVKNYPNGVSVSLGDFALTSAAVAAIPSTATITFSTPVTFEGDMTLKKMCFEKEVTLKNGNIELSKGFEVEGENVLEGNSLTLNRKINVKNANVKIASSEIDVTDTQITVNGGTLTIDAKNANGVRAAIKLGTNGGGISSNNKNLEAGLTEVIVNSDVVGQVTASYGGLVENNATVSTLSAQNGGLVDNNGTATSILVYGSSVINNYGEINGGQIMNPASLVNQKGTGVMKNVMNKGKIVTEVGSQTSSVTNYGEIVYVEGARVKTAELSTGVVTYKAPETFALSDFAHLNSSVTKVLFENDFTFNITDEDVNEFVMKEANVNIKEMEFKGDLIVTTGKKVTLIEGTKLCFTGTASVVKGGTISNVETIVVGVANTATAPANNEINTDLEIKKGTTIETVKNVYFYGSKSQVWNDGTVNKADDFSVNVEGRWN